MKKIDLLRQWLRDHKLDAFIFPSTDPHCGEYVPDHWKTREWISGFNGSAGTAVVTPTRAALWTDSRYWLAAEEQLAGTPFELVRCRRNVATAAELIDWIRQEHTQGEPLAVGIDGWVNTIDCVRELREALHFEGEQLVVTSDPADELWEGRPAIPLNPIEIQPMEFAGEEARHKIERLRDKLRGLYASATLITQLDDIAWLTNLRGTDVHCCPLFVAYMIVTYDDATLFIDPQKVSPEVATYLRGQGIGLKNYTDIEKAMETLPQEGIVIDPATCNYKVAGKEYNAPKVTDIAGRKFELPARYIFHESLIAPMKAVKNEVEIRGYHSAMHKDGVALVKFLRWLSEGKWTMANGQWTMNGEVVTEISIDQKLTGLRAKQPLYRDISFDTIAGYGYHGAIVHYEATPETDIPLEPHGLLLLDSGAQYQDGTTDITRTIALGPLTEEEKTDYTLVLKGHIRLAMAKFPSGSSGTQLDALARYAMWQQGLNFLHGTGHGVGSYLNVHEGPHQFRMNYVPAPLLANMTITNEPGIYKAGKHGCRTENTMLITHYCDGDFGEFLQFEPLTLCPIDTRPIRREMMLPDEIEWLNQYHRHVFKELAPLLDDEADREWLKEATKEI